MRVTASAAGRGTIGRVVPGAGAYVVLRLPPAGRVEVEVLDETGAEIAGATVEVRAGEASLSAETDEGGRVRFEGVAPGPVVLRARAPGRAPVSEGPFPVTADVPVRRQLLLPGAVLLSGRVLDGTTGAPIPDAEVHVAHPGRAVAADPTGADGGFGPVAAGAPGERVLVAVRAEGYGPILEPLFLPDAAAAHEVELVLEPAPPWVGRVEDTGGRPVAGARVTFTADGVAGRAPPSIVTDEGGRFEIAPPPPPAPGRRIVLTAEGPGGHAALALRPGDAAPRPLTLVLRGGVTVTGRVVDPDGTPVAGAVIRMDPIWSALADRRRPGPETSRLLALNEMGRVRLTATSGDGGHFRLESVPDGPYFVHVERGGSEAWAPDRLEVRGTDVDLGTLALGAGARIGGRISDEAGRSLAGVAVRLVALDEHRRGYRAVTDDHGDWTVAGVPEGRYQLRAGLAGYQAATTEVAVGEETSIDLVLPAGARIEGRVFDGDRPYTRVFRVALRRTGRAAGRTPRGTFRNAEGRFLLEGVPEGEWTVVAETPDGRVHPAPVPVVASAGRRFEVTLHLQPGGVIAGTVRDAAGGAAAGARVTLTGAEPLTRRTATAAADGAFAFEGLSPGRYTYEARGRGGAPATGEVVLGVGSRTALAIDLEPGGALTVSVIGADGKPRADAVVLARRPNGPVVSSGPPPRTGADGTVRIADLPLTPVELVVRTPAGETGAALGDPAPGPGSRAVVRVFADDR
jgi:protocatechuate 3,4-dioxygenase beta subunit